MNCGEEDAVKYSKYSNGKFCSRKCSRAYSTKENQAARNEKISKKLKGIYKKTKYCNYCHQEMKRSEGDLGKSVCDGCKDWYRYVTLFKKMGTYKENTSLDKINEETIKLLLDLYFNQRKSKPLLKAEYNLRENTIYNYFTKNGIELRTLSEAIINSFYTGRKNVNSVLNYKQGWHETWDGKKVYYRSSYELKYAKELDRKQVPYEMEFKRFLYWNSVENKWRIAIPDFYLPLENKIVEIKSTYSLNEAEMRDKEKEYKKQGYDFELLVMNWKS